MRIPPFRCIFENTTVAKLAVAIQNLKKGEESSPISARYENREGCQIGRGELGMGWWRVAGWVFTYLRFSGPIFTMT